MTPSDFIETAVVAHNSIPWNLVLLKLLSIPAVLTFSLVGVKSFQFDCAFVKSVQILDLLGLIAFSLY